MPFPKLSQLQSRLVVSATASIILLLIYLSTSSPSFAYAAEVDSIRPEDHNHDRLSHMTLFGGDEVDGLELREAAYESDFFGFDRSIIGRATPETIPLINNTPDTENIVLGEGKYYIFTNNSLWEDITDDSYGLPSPVRRRDSDSNSTSLHEEELRWISDNANVEREESGELGARQTASGKTRTLYVTVNTCMQPSSNTTTAPPPQLELYVSVSDENQKPGPNVTSNQDKITLDGGAGSLVVNATGNVYMSVWAPNATEFSGVYSAEIAASINAPYHYYNSSTPNLYLIDSDNQAALLVTDNLTHSSSNSSVYKEWMDLDPPFVIFASNQNDTSILGVQHSYCGLEQYANIKGTINEVRTDAVQYSMTTRGLGNLPKQQFYFTGLNSSSNYYGILAMDGNSTAHGAGVVGGGGKVYKTMNFSTIADNNCAVIFNLSFCDQVAYAVPSNPNTFPDTTTLAAFYDNYTQSMYQFFDYSLQQVPCNMTSSGQYSLARTCDDCAAAYKQWICSVTMPRCTDFSKPYSWLQARNINQPFPNGTTLPTSYTDPLKNIQYLNASRNPNIDEFVRPGPYKEVLPCADLCYDLVQSCPASFGFGCPQPGYLGFNQSYGVRPDAVQEDAGEMTCNYPGAAFYLSGAESLRRSAGSWSVWIVGFVMSAVLLM